MVSGQATLYQRVSGPVGLGAVNVCATVLSPLVGELPPTIAVYVPEWEAVEIDVVPVRVHPVKSPVSNPPLVTPAGPMTAGLTVVAWEFAAVPAQVVVYVARGGLAAV